MIFRNVRRGTQLGIVFIYYPIIGRIFRVLFRKTLTKFHYEHTQFSATRVTRRSEKGRASEGVDLWDLVLRREEEKVEAVVSKEQMDSNAGFFMVAGTETTATELSGLTYMLLTTPAAMTKSVLEIRSTFATSEAISMELLAGLPYLHACIKEALRIYPPVPVGLPHPTPMEGSTICGHFVPPNVSLKSTIVSLWRAGTDNTQ